MNVCLVSKTKLDFAVRGCHQTYTALEQGKFGCKKQISRSKNVFFSDLTPNPTLHPPYPQTPQNLENNQNFLK